MRKILIFIIISFLSVTVANAAGLEKVLKNLDINQSSVSVSVKNIKDGTEVYSLNANMPMTPASTLKIITAAAALDSLTSDYKFTTALFKSTNNDLYLKLGADPFLKTSDLDSLFAVAYDKQIIEPKKIFIDDFIFDSREWGEGWQWDDELNPLMPKFSAYNLDSNLLNIDINVSNAALVPIISIKPYYPINVMNFVNSDISKRKDLNFEKADLTIPNTIVAFGDVIANKVVKIPVPNPRIYFNLRLDESVRKEKILYSGIYPVKRTPQNNIYLVSKIEHNFADALDVVLKNSDNMVAETIFKLAGAKAQGERGSLQHSLTMLNRYLNTLNIEDDNIKIVDGSGVSKNNIVTANFMTNFLAKLSQTENFELLNNYLPSPGEGTLKNRMLYFKDSMKAKTGTLSDTSAIAGYITTQKGEMYAFDIMIKDVKTTDNDKKNIEEQILRYIYMN